MSTRYRQLATHLRGLSDDELNDLLVDLPAIASAPWLTPPWRTRWCRTGYGCGRRHQPTAGRSWLAPRPSRWAQTRGYPDGQEGGRAGWRAWTRGGDPVAIGGLCWWRRRLDAAGALDWMAGSIRSDASRWDRAHL